MRGTVARRLRRQAREIHSRPGRQQENKLNGVRVKRGANNMARRKWARFYQVKALLGRGFSHTIAESMVPQVEPTSIIAVCTGPRATYKFLKKLHRERRR